MMKVIGIPLGIVFTSMFFFPFEFNALPSMNTKKMMAAAALVILLWKLIQKRELKMNKDFLIVSIFAGLVSVCGIVSVTINNTNDYAYATYITSAWVWWGGAYTVACYLRWLHGRFDMILLTRYLMAVCAMQCCIALAIDLSPAFKYLVMSIFATGDGYFAKGGVQRMYGIGCALDVAGIRFSLVLVLMLYMKMQSKVSAWWEDTLFYLTFFFIATVGSMIGRTTLVGMVIGVAYLGFLSLRQLRGINVRYLTMWKRGLLIMLVFIPVVVFFYQTNSRIRKNIRFGFEGFFSLVEKGQWKVSSNETLKDMVVWPDNSKTWTIGDGYFDNPVATDPYYTGQRTEGFYMNSDIGYVRFIFYFGIMGLLAFSLYMLKVGQVCASHFPDKRMLILMLLAVQFIVWAKVATDTFLLFALLLCLDEDNIPDSGNVQLGRYGTGADAESQLAPASRA